MENPDVVLEIEKTDNDDKVTLSYKVNSREKDESRSAIEFLQIISSIFGSPYLDDEEGEEKK